MAGRQAGAGQSSRAAHLPGGASHWRPRRPRPAVWWSVSGYGSLGCVIGEKLLRRLALRRVEVGPPEPSLDMPVDGLVGERVAHRMSTTSTPTSASASAASVANTGRPSLSPSARHARSASERPSPRVARLSDPTRAASTSPNGATSSPVAQPRRCGLGVDVLLSRAWVHPLRGVLATATGVLPGRLGECFDLDDLGAASCPACGRTRRAATCACYESSATCGCLPDLRALLLAARAASGSSATVAVTLMLLFA